MQEIGVWTTALWTIMKTRKVIFGLSLEYLIKSGEGSSKMKQSFVSAALTLPAMAFLGVTGAEATNIPATISSTLMITTNSRLTGNVTCTVTGAPCIKFGASGITLNLNGFSMKGSPGCALGEDGIDTNLQNNVTIRGPGLVNRFRGNGIVVSGNTSLVRGVAITFICGDGIRVLGYQNAVINNSVSRASQGGFFAGIALAGSGQHSIQHNEVGGAGPAGDLDHGGTGISVLSVNNYIRANNASGNQLVGIVFGTGSTGNTVDKNQVLGNLETNSPFVSLDIEDANDPPANTYTNNLCDRATLGSSFINVCELPNIAGHRDP